MSVAHDISIFAPAKINLSLRIVGRREDGYHYIKTLMQKIDLCDHIHIRLVDSKGISLTCSRSDLPCDDDNLVYRAAQRFFSETGLPCGVSIDLKKNIPVAAGLGGGSSDAAAVLLGLNALLKIGFSQDLLLNMALSLGADVPFFIRQETALWAEGIGEKFVEAPNLKKYWIVLVNPGFDVSTKWAYETFALTTNRNPFMVAPGQGQDFESISVDESQRIFLYNDLETVTLGRFPEIGILKNDLLSFGAAGALMSGSGPTVFGIFFDEKEAVICKDSIQNKYAGRVFVSTPLTKSKNDFFWGVVKR